MAGRGHDPRKRLPLSQRASLLAKGFRSMIGRYPGDLARALRSGASGGDHHEDALAQGLTLAPDLRDRWAALPDAGGISGVLWLGHCSVLMKVGGITVLTDPVLSPIIGPRVGLGRYARTLGPSRLTPLVALAHDLPRPDLILISHAHYDHLDRPTLQALANKHTVVLTAQSTRSLVPRGPLGFAHVLELPWDKTRRFEGLEIAALRPNHWGARNAWDRHRGYNSYVVSGDAPASRTLFAGDTAYTEAFRGVGPTDLAIMGVGAYDPWRHAHATPEEAWTMAGHADARLVLPVHYGTFKLSNEPHDEPLARLYAAAQSPQERQRILALPPGELRPLI